MHLAYASAYAASALVCALIATAAWRRRSARGALGLTLLCAGQAWWSASYALQLVFSGDGPSFFWYLARAPGLQLTPTAILILALGYVGRTRFLHWRTMALLAVEPVTMYALTLTDPWHHWVLGGNEPAFTFVSGGPPWWANVVYSYAIIILAAVLLLIHFFSRHAYRLQTAVLATAVMLPVVQFLAQLAGVRPWARLNSVPFTYMLTGIVLWFALTRLGLFSVVPVARGRLVEQMSEGVIVFDSNHQIADINPAAMRMTSVASTCIGKTADEAFPNHAEAISALRAVLEAGDGPTCLRTRLAGDRIVETTASLIRASGGGRLATLVILRDITEQTRATLELEERSEQLAAALERASRVLESMTDGVLLVDIEGIVVDSNPAAEEVLHKESSQIVGKPLGDILPSLCTEEMETESITSMGPIVTTLSLLGGRSLMVEVIPLLAGESRGAYSLVVLRDETERLAAERMQRDFIANAAHELQTPLTGLSLLAETIPRALASDPASAETFLGRLGGEIRRLVLMTNELMALSRMDASTGLHVPTPVDLSQTVADEVGAIRHLAEERRQSVSVQVPESVIVACDEADLRSMVSNLLDNAVRYSPEGGTVEVSLSLGANSEGRAMAQLSVADNGPGIPAAEQERIFERFYRLDKSRSSRTGGAGLGLSIVRRGVERAGGNVSVTSAPGEGSTFTLWLPVARDESAETTSS